MMNTKALVSIAIIFVAAVVAALLYFQNSKKAVAIQSCNDDANAIALEMESHDDFEVVDEIYSYIFKVCLRKEGYIL